MITRLSSYMASRLPPVYIWDWSAKFSLSTTSYEQNILRFVYDSVAMTGYFLRTMSFMNLEGQLHTMVVGAVVISHPRRPSAHKVAETGAGAKRSKVGPVNTLLMCVSGTS